MSNEKYYGKYRATVVNNIDPELRGRLVVSVPDVPGAMPSSWAEACVPITVLNGQVPGSNIIPPVGTPVWVEFENGDADRPIWVGCRWTVPIATPPIVPGDVTQSGNIVIRSAGENAIILSDAPGPGGGIILKSPQGASIQISDDGIYIKNGRGAGITLIGPTVTINNGALVIT